jgi:hypothetical protein
VTLSTRTSEGGVPVSGGGGLTSGGGVPASEGGVVSGLGVPESGSGGLVSGGEVPPSGVVAPSGRAPPSGIVLLSGGGVPPSGVGALLSAIVPTSAGDEPSGDAPEASGAFAPLSERDAMPSSALLQPNPIAMTQSTIGKDRKQSRISLGTRRWFESGISPSRSWSSCCWE